MYKTGIRKKKQQKNSPIYSLAKFCIGEKTKIGETFRMYTYIFNNIHVVLCCLFTGNFCFDLRNVSVVILLIVLYHAVRLRY